MPGFGNGKVSQFYRTVSREHRSQHSLIHINVFRLRRCHLTFHVQEIFPRLVRFPQEHISFGDGCVQTSRSAQVRMAPGGCPINSGG